MVDDSKKIVIFQTEQGWCTYELREHESKKACTGLSQLQCQNAEENLDTKSYP